MAANNREIERKYLLKALPPEAAAAPYVEIDQGYLPGERILERIRRVRPAGAGAGGERAAPARYIRTIKLGSGIERFEFEEDTTEAFFLAVWPLTRGRRVQKRRYSVMAGSNEWVVDDFSDRTLVLAEIELERVDQAVVVPQWLGSAMASEVTDDPAFTNFRLAR